MTARDLDGSDPCLDVGCRAANFLRALKLNSEDTELYHVALVIGLDELVRIGLGEDAIQIAEATERRAEVLGFQARLEIDLLRRAAKTAQGEHARPGEYEQLMAPRGN